VTVLLIDLNKKDLNGCLRNPQIICVVVECFMLFRFFFLLLSDNYFAFNHYAYLVRHRTNTDTLCLDSI
jgi:hypothetical protein